MNKLKKSIITSAAAAWVLLGYGAGVARADDQPAPPGEQPAPAGEQPAAPAGPTAMTTPGDERSACGQPKSVQFRRRASLGPVYVTGAVSGLGLWQNNIFPDQQHSLASLSNGQVFLQKTDGLFQYFLDVGAYTFPALGSPYFSTATTVGDFFGPVPVAYAKLAPTDNFYIQGGKMPGLVGVENPLYVPKHEHRARSLMGSRAALSVAAVNSAIRRDLWLSPCSGPTVFIQTATLG